MRFSQLFFRFVHRNCLIFGTKVNLGNTYILDIFILFEQFLIPIIPLYLLKKAKKCVFLNFSSDWVKIVFSWKNNLHTWKISFGVKFVFLIFLLWYLGKLLRDLALCACSYLSLSTSHFNLEYLDLCKFKLFDEQLKRGLVI